MYEFNGFKLNDDEVLTKLNKDTGELKELHKRRNNLPKGKQPKFGEGAFWSKTFDSAIEYLSKVLTPVELKVVILMSSRTKPVTNSLDPLSDDTAYTEIAETFNIHRNSVPKILNKLKYFGVYGILNVSNQGVPTNVWLFNPYISYRGKLMSEEVIHLFDDTFIALAVKKSMIDKDRTSVTN